MYVDTSSHTVNRLFLSREKLTSNGIFELISASKLPWTQKTNILRLVTKYLSDQVLHICICMYVRMCACVNGYARLNTYVASNQTSANFQPENICC